MENQNSKSPKKKLYSTPTTSPFLEITGLIILLKKFHTFNKISFLFPKHLISRFLIGGNIIKKYIFISHSNHFWGVLQIWRISHTLSYFFHFGEPIGAQNLLKISILKNLLKIKWCTWRLTIIIFPPLRRDFRGRLHAGVICKLQLNRISIYKEIEDPNPSEDRYVIQFLSLRPFKRFNATNHGVKFHSNFLKKKHKQT